MNLFYLRNDKSYSYLIEAIKLDLKQKYNKDVNAYYFQNPKFKLESLLFVLKQVLILRIFDNEKIYKIEYKNIHIGQYSLARCLRNPKSYYSKFFKDYKESTSQILQLIREDEAKETEKLLKQVILPHLTNDIVSEDFRFYF